MDYRQPQLEQLDTIQPWLHFGRLVRQPLEAGHQSLRLTCDIEVESIRPDTLRGVEEKRIVEQVAVHLVDRVLQEAVEYMRQAELVIVAAVVVLVEVMDMDKRVVLVVVE